MVHQSAGLSSKARGKRPMRNGVAATPSSLSALTPSTNSPAVDEETDEGSLAPSAGSVRARFNHKRVLPSRIRRGGIGSLVGTNEIDVNILDTLKRKGENEPLIPARTVFILTTDSSQVPSASTSEIGLNNIANERYFERPEVIRAYKNQQDIQVPEFDQLDEELVGGKLRVRNGGTECYELTDEAYEKRHRKHEMIEKRQRLREKEQLQHEHYKLKERIEQLRNMDPNAFTALPNDIFGTPEGAASADLPDGAESSIGSAASLHEAERRRKLMLDVAMSLEERYRTLLPTERRPAETRHAAQRASMSVEPSIPDDHIDGASATPDQDAASTDSRQKPSKLKLSLRGSARPTPPPTAVMESSRKRKEVSVRKETSPLPPEPDQLEDSISVTASYSISSRQRRAKTRQRLKSPHYVGPQPTERLDSFSEASRLANHVSRISLSDQNEYLSDRHLNSHGRASIVNYDATLEASSPASAASRRRRYAMKQQDPDLKMIQYVPQTDEEPSRKKKKAGHIRDQAVYRVSGGPESFSDAQYSIAIATDLTQGQNDVRAEQPVTPPLSQTDQFPLEPFEVGMAIRDASAGPIKESSFPPPDDRSVSLPQLRLLEQPDEDEEEEIDVTEQPEVNETPTADEPVTPPVEPDTVADSIIAEKHETYLVPTHPEPVNKKRRRQSTPYARREPSTSLPPELPESISLSVISMRSYEIPTVIGKGRKSKPLGYLLAASKHNVEPGRKTGRSVKAFGVEVPPFELGKEVEFELPHWLIREVASRRVDNMSDAGSDGDPPSFAAGMPHGEAQLGSLLDSISTAERYDVEHQ